MRIKSIDRESLYLAELRSVTVVDTQAIHARAYGDRGRSVLVKISRNRMVLRRLQVLEETFRGLGLACANTFPKLRPQNTMAQMN